MIGLIFDMDGVLVDTESIHYESWKLALEAEGVNIDSAFYQQRIQARKREWVLEDLFPGSPNGEHQRIIDKKVALFKTYIDEKREELPFKDVLFFLRQLETQKLPFKAIVASASRNAEEVLIVAGIRDFFVDVVTSKDVERGKPFPDIFLLAADKLGLPIEDCYVFEDSLSGIQAGLAARIATIAVDRESKLKVDGPVLVIKDFYDEHVIKFIFCE